ncbi:MAG: hypothetical protein FD143_3520 [Ignavibacteria bacterium]|nr:MAG: hypothetical protein FD143_3520 [Ignavibacteria bacterium]
MLEIWRRVYGKYIHGEREKTKFPNQEPVRISAAKTVFDKGYLPNWTNEVFKIKEVINNPRKVYKIQDLEGEEVKGTFYPEELQSVAYDFPKEYQVEETIKTRKRKGQTEAFVKWKGYPSRYNSWIPQQDLQKYGKN